MAKFGFAAAAAIDVVCVSALAIQLGRQHSAISSQKLQLPCAELA